MQIEGFNELHEDALTVLTGEFRSYKEIKPLIDAKTEYGVNTNGAHQILTNLEEWKLVEVKREDVMRGKMVVGTKSFWRIKL